MPNNKAVEDWKREQERNPENVKCNICKAQGSVETVEQTYLECPKVIAFIIAVKNVFNKNISIFPGNEWKNNHYMFGTLNRKHSIFYMVLRSCIWYECEKKRKEPNITEFIGSLIDRTEKLCKASTWKVNDRPIQKNIVLKFERILEELKRYVKNIHEKITFRISN